MTKRNIQNVNLEETTEIGEELKRLHHVNDFHTATTTTRREELVDVSHRRSEIPRIWESIHGDLIKIALRQRSSEDRDESAFTVLTVVYIAMPRMITLFTLIVSAHFRFFRSHCTDTSAALDK